MKPVLVSLDASRWQRAKIRAAALGLTIAEFVDEALAQHLVATEAVERLKLAESDAATRSYVAAKRRR